MTSTDPGYDRLDELANRWFPGRVVRKDLVRQVKVGAELHISGQNPRVSESFLDLPEVL